MTNKVVVALQRGGKSVSSGVVKLRSSGSNTSWSSALTFDAINNNGPLPPLALDMNLSIDPANDNFVRKSFTISISSFPSGKELASFTLDASRFAKTKKDQHISFSTSFTPPQPEESGSVDVRIEGSVLCISNEDGSHSHGNHHHHHKQIINDYIGDINNTSGYESAVSSVGEDAASSDNDNENNDKSNNGEDNNSHFSFASSSHVDPGAVNRLKGKLDSVDAELSSVKEERQKIVEKEKEISSMVEAAEKNALSFLNGGDEEGSEVNNDSEGKKNILDLVTALIDRAETAEAAKDAFALKLKKKDLSHELLVKRATKLDNEIEIHKEENDTIAQKLVDSHEAHDHKGTIASRHTRIMQELSLHHSVESDFRKERSASVAFHKDVIQKLEDYDKDEDDGIIIIDDSIGEEDEDEENAESNNGKGFFAARGLVRLRTRNTKLKETIVKLGKDIRKTRTQLSKTKQDRVKREQGLNSEINALKQKLEDTEESWIKARDELMKEFNNLNKKLATTQDELKSTTKARDLFMKENEESSTEIEKLEDKIEACEEELSESKADLGDQIERLESELIDVKLKFAENLTDSGMSHGHV